LRAVEFLFWFTSLASHTLKVNLMRSLFGWAVAIVAALASAQVGAVEVLVNGTLEESVSPSGWLLTQNITGQPSLPSVAVEQIDAANDPADLGSGPTPLGLFIKPFAGNVGAYEGQNYLTNVSLQQTVNGFANRTYTFIGNARFAGDGDPMTNEGYSGGVATLDADSPSGAIASPTVTKFQLEFLDVNNAVLGAPTVVDLRAAGQMNDSTWMSHTLSALSPANTRRVRVSAIATDMIANTADQNLYWDNFSLKDSASTTERLANANLNILGPPNGFQLTGPAGYEPFSNHTPGGQRGLWIRAFEGGNFEMSQTVAAQPGAEYDFSVWSLWETGYSGGLDPDGTPTTISVTFLDSSAAVIGSPTVLKLAGTNGANQQNDTTWRQFAIENAIAPANAASVRIAVAAQNMFNSLLNPQSAFFDDFSLIQTSTAAVAGDYNNNGTVGPEDYTLWASKLGQAVATAGLSNLNPAKADTVIDASDYTYWRDRTGGPAAAAAVPEPMTLCLALLATIAAVSVRRGGR
jgi:hypothetical protein